MMQTICWQADAPSNIALIKYMGKQDEEKNIPSNPSLSYTLNHLQSRVRLILTHAEKMPPINIQNSTEKTIKRKIEQSMDHWQVLKVPGFNHELHLSNFAINRYLKHLKRIKSHYNLTMPFQVFSNNNFPQACGLASSAASFAALTKAAVSACSDLTDQKTDLQTQAQLSRLGSGSSCRSFMGPFVLWENTTIRTVDTAYSTLLHLVVIIDQQKKNGKLYSSTSPSPDLSEIYGPISTR